MIRYIHRVAFAIFPVIIPTPRNYTPTFKDELDAEIEIAKKKLQQLQKQRSYLRGQEREQEIIINELELLHKETSYND